MNEMKAAYVRGSKNSGKGGEKELQSVRIKEADNGGFILTCDYETKGEGDSPGSYESLEKVFATWGEAADLLDDLYGDGEEDEETE